MSEENNKQYVNKLKKAANEFKKVVNTEIDESETRAENLLIKLTKYAENIDKIAKKNKKTTTGLQHFINSSKLSKESSDFEKSQIMLSYINEASAEVKKISTITAAQRHYLNQIGGIAEKEIRIANPDKITPRYIKERGISKEQILEFDKEHLHRLSNVHYAVGGKPLISTEVIRKINAVSKVLIEKVSKAGTKIANKLPFRKSKNDHRSH